MRSPPRFKLRHANQQKSSNKQHSRASLKRQLSATIGLATAVDGTLVEVMKIVAEWSPEDMIPAHISQAFSLIQYFQ